MRQHTVLRHDAAEQANTEVRYIGKISRLIVDVSSIFIRHAKGRQMTVSFSAKRLKLRPGDGDEMVVEDGDRAVPVKPKPDPLIKSPEPPPFGVMRVIKDGNVASSVRLSETEGASVVVRDWVKAHGAPDGLDVDIHASIVTDDDLDPLLVVGRRHRLPITVNLLADV